VVHQHGLALGFAVADSQAILIDDHFDNSDLATGGANAVNGGFQRVSNGIGGNGTASESGTLVTITTGETPTNTTGIESLNTFDATALSEFTVTWVVDSASTPEGNGLLFAADSNTGLWGPSVYLKLNGDGDAILSSTHTGTTAEVVIDDSVDIADLTGGFTLSLTYNTNGVSWSQTGIASFHATGSRTWDDLNGTQTFGYSDVFDSTVHVSAWNQNYDFTTNTMSIDSVTVIPEPSSIAMLLLGAGTFAVRRSLVKRRR